MSGTIKVKEIRHAPENPPGEMGDILSRKKLYIGVFLLTYTFCTAG
jgi:hypothetical protein